MNRPFIVADAVRAALAAKTAVVALETTVITHGLPQPQSFETALELEQRVRAEGAVPATIGVLDGAIKIGLTRVELERLAETPDVVKVNPSNLAAVVASGQPGSTTGAATMLAAHACGIRVFATGGIGGVHRDADVTGDISADLTTLARIPVAVVCAGAKAILDLPRTRELLETLGVPVLGVGTDELPAFYRRTSGLRVDARCDTVEQLAAAVRTHFSVGLPSGVLIANPVPEADELPEAIYERALEGALTAAAAAHVTGRALTPFLLDRLRALSGGASVRTNIALLHHNVQVAARLALALAGE